MLSQRFALLLAALVLLGCPASSPAPTPPPLKAAPSGPILAEGIYPNAAALRQVTPPTVQHFARLLGGNPPGHFAYVPTSTLTTDDGWTTIIPLSPPPTNGGAWVIEPDVDRGADITTASGTVVVGWYGGPWRVIPAATLTGGLTVQLDGDYVDAGAIPAGATIELTRLDLGAYTVTVVDKGSSTTLCVMPVSAAAHGVFYFTGSAFMKRSCVQML